MSDLIIALTTLGLCLLYVLIAMASLALPVLAVLWLLKELF